MADTWGSSPLLLVPPLARRGSLLWHQFQTAASSPAAALKQEHYDYYVLLKLTLFFNLSFFFFLKQSVMTSEILK